MPVDHRHRHCVKFAVLQQQLPSLIAVWYVLTRRQPYRGFSHERIACKYLTWAWRMDDEARDGLTRQQFARYYMMKLGIGRDLTRIALDPKRRRGAVATHPRRIASEAEVLALRPELQHIE
jgi:hypothetical protein